MTDQQLQLLIDCINRQTDDLILLIGGCCIALITALVILVAPRR